tara:strand:- start:1754 stop:2524 length:771 start_codon:yes stop_codon:yes gene_type:complete
MRRLKKTRLIIDVKLLFENWRRYLTESKVKVSDKLSETAFNTMSAMSVFAEEGILSEEGARQLEYEVSPAENPVGDVIVKFRDSLYSGKRSGFLSYYSPKELARMDLYLLKEHNAGFAIKDGDDIVSVHNNSDLSGLGNEFMRKAKEVGGARLDHFDGFLSGLYRKHGFTDVYEIYQWDEQYKPEKWNYKPVNVMDPSTSVYSFALKNLVYEDPATLPNDETEVVAENEFEITINPNLKHNSYKHGRPDVIMRKLA